MPSLRSLVSRYTKHGTSITAHSSWRPPLSVTTKPAARNNVTKGKYSSFGIRTKRSASKRCPRPSPRCVPRLQRGRRTAGERSGGSCEQFEHLRNPRAVVDELVAMQRTSRTPVGTAQRGSSAAGQPRRHPEQCSRPFRLPGRARARGSRLRWHLARSGCWRCARRSGDSVPPGTDSASRCSADPLRCGQTSAPRRRPITAPMTVVIVSP